MKDLMKEYKKIQKHYSKNTHFKSPYSDVDKKVFGYFAERKDSMKGKGKTPQLDYRMRYVGGSYAV
jgi:hypothetical protein